METFCEATHEDPHEAVVARVARAHLLLVTEPSGDGFEEGVQLLETAEQDLARVGKGDLAVLDARLWLLKERKRFIAKTRQTVAGFLTGDRKERRETLEAQRPIDDQSFALARGIIDRLPPGTPAHLQHYPCRILSIARQHAHEFSEENHEVARAVVLANEACEKLSVEIRTSPSCPQR